ncbi:hypothetical protein Daus18300_000318 [Diaporthe australafricana]|uniref:Uncharacterized protein n=1 Tax=Diaporthe australafricana TaxID=127596 RepID=A0ABR3Y5N4_9PEZI
MPFVSKVVRSVSAVRGSSAANTAKSRTTAVLNRPFRWPAISKAISDLIPVLYVRLHQDKQAYKFICRHTSDRIFRQQEYYYESANVGVGHHATTEKRHANQTPLNLEQVYEAATLGHKVLLTLMGIKVLQYLKDIEHASIFLKGEFTNFPQEMIDLICEGMGAGSSTEPFGFSFIKATGEPAWRREKISEMQQLITKFVRGVMRRNGYTWMSMLNVERWLTPRRFARYLYDTCIRWDEDSTAKLLAIRQYQVWMETPGSFAVLRQAMNAAGFE